MKNKKIQEVVDEAARILKDYPELTYTAAIKIAKEILYDEKNLPKPRKGDTDMTKEEIISQLESLKEHCEDFKEPLTPDDIWHKDVIALKYAIALIKKEPAAPQQNRPLENNYSLIITESEAKVNE